MNHCHCLSNCKCFAFKVACVIVGVRYIDCVNCFLSACCCTALCNSLLCLQMNVQIAWLPYTMRAPVLTRKSRMIHWWEFFLSWQTVWKKNVQLLACINHLAAWPVYKMWCNTSTKFELKSSEVMSYAWKL